MTGFLSALRGGSRGGSGGSVVVVVGVGVGFAVAAAAAVVAALLAADLSGPTARPSASASTAAATAAAGADVACFAGFVPVEPPDAPLAAAACEPCPPGTFALPGWRSCQPYLTCSRIRREVGEAALAVEGTSKRVYRALWRSPTSASAAPVALIRCRDDRGGAVLADCQHGMDMLRALTPSRFVVQPLGFCDARRELVVEWADGGGADRLAAAPLDRRQRAWLALDLVQAIGYLHASPAGPRVMCDANTPSKLLSQCVLVRDAARGRHTGVALKLADLDALPLAAPPSQLPAGVQCRHREQCGSETGTVRCGHRPLRGDGVAPEQRWLRDEPYSDERMPGYGLAVDIWKLPGAVAALLQLGNAAAAGDDAKGTTRRVLADLASIADACHAENATRRPSAQEAARRYSEALAPWL